MDADESLAETVILLVSELVTNAVVHTGCPAVLRLVLPAEDPGEAPAGAMPPVRLEVADADCRAPVPRCSDEDETGGRGLALVDGLADRWGWTREGAGKRIWCELDRGAQSGTGGAATVAYGTGVAACGGLAYEAV